MKRKLFFPVVLIFMSGHLFSQKKQNDTHGSQVQMEILGPGGKFSFHFESRFIKRVAGLGYTVGFGVAPYNLEETCNDGGFITIPAGLNYLLGKQRHILEMGAGVVLKIFGSGTKVGCPEIDDNFFEGGDPAYFYSLLGYRYQPASKRLLHQRTRTKATSFIERTKRSSVIAFR